MTPDLRRPPGWLFYGAMAIGALALAYDVSAPGGGFVVALLAVVGLVAGAATWLIRVVAYLRGKGEDRAPSRGDIAQFVVCPLALVALWSVVAADLPLEARWAASRDAFEDVADDPSAFDSVERLGLYEVDRVEREGAGVTFWVSGAGGMFGEAGFSYLPEGARSAVVDREYEPLGGPWFWWATAG